MPRGVRRKKCLKGKKRGPKIRFHDEYHRVHREQVRKSLAKKKRKHTLVIEIPQKDKDRRK